MNSYKGYFKPKNPSKYKGDPLNIIYRSRWEAVFMGYLDNHPDVLQWSSEELIIPYLSPIDGKWHRYFPDFVIKKRNPAGKVEIVVVEIKPLAQTKEPVKQTKINRRYITEVRTWGINQAKWQAAKQFCEKREWKFIIMTEKELGIKW